MTLFALVWALPSAAQDHNKKQKNGDQHGQKDANRNEGSAEAPDKILYDHAIHDIKKGHHEEARLTLQTLINTYPDSAYLAKAKLAIADSYFKEGGSANLAQAIAAYKDFIVFFPFLPQAAYAQMQVAMTHFREMAKPDRDRSEALAAEDEFQTFLEKYPNNPLVPKANQYLRDVQEVLAEGDFRVGYYYYVKGDRRAAAGRLLEVTNRYPLYSQSDKALWMLGDIFEKSEKKEIASLYYAKIVREYPLSPLVPEAKKKLIALSVPVPQPDPKALAWMQANENAPRPHESFLKKPLDLFRSGPRDELVDAARFGQPNMQPESDSDSNIDILRGGGSSVIGAGGGSAGAGNTAVVEVATPGSGASGGSSGSAAATPPSSGQATPALTSDPGSGAEGGSDMPSTPSVSPAAGSAPRLDPSEQVQVQQEGDKSQAPAASTDQEKLDKKHESSSKKKKGLKKLIPW
jgi:outer membrane protein assembly factor BamD